MKRFIAGLSTLILLVFALMCRSVLGADNSLALEIRCDKQQYHVDEPITIEYRLINKGTKEITIHRDLYMGLVVEGKGKYRISATPINPRDEKQMTEVLTGPLAPQPREKFITLLPGYYYGSTFVISPKVGVKGEISSLYRGYYDGHEFGLNAWADKLIGNTIFINVVEK